VFVSFQIAAANKQPPPDERLIEAAMVSARSVARMNAQQHLRALFARSQLRTTLTLWVVCLRIML